MKQTHRLRDFFLLLGMTSAAVAVHGYHRGIEDMAVYLPAIKKLLTPALYPYDAAFFPAVHTHDGVSFVRARAATRADQQAALTLCGCGNP